MPQEVEVKGKRGRRENHGNSYPKRSSNKAKESAWLLVFPHLLVVAALFKAEWCFCRDKVCPIDKDGNGYLLAGSTENEEAT